MAGWPERAGTTAGAHAAEIIAQPFLTDELVVDTPSASPPLHRQLVAQALATALLTLLAFGSATRDHVHYIFFSHLPTVNPSTSHVNSCAL